jgi:hypothetical protein
VGVAGWGVGGKDGGKMLTVSLALRWHDCYVEHSLVAWAAGWGLGAMGRVGLGCLAKKEG